MRSQIIYFVLGAIIFLVFGAIQTGNNYASVILLFSILAALIGWFIGWLPFSMYKMQPPKSYLQHRIYRFPFWFTLAIFLSAVTSIGLLYGYPVMQDNPTESRLEQRNYALLMFAIEYGSVILVLLGYRLKIHGYISSGKFTLLVLFVLATSVLLAVRYLALQALLALFILAANRASMIDLIKKAAWAIIVFFVLFVSVQYFRTTDASSELLYEVLFRRLFLVHYDIFELTISNDFNLPYPTYLSPIYGIFGMGLYNTGFILFDMLEGSNPDGSQGYAPVSLLGEAFMNASGMHVVIPLLIILFIFIFLHLIYKSMLLTLNEEIRYLYSAVVGMEFLRMFAHSLFGTVSSMIIFYLWLKLFDLLGHLVLISSKNRNREAGI